MAESGCTPGRPGFVAVRLFDLHPAVLFLVGFVSLGNPALAQRTGDLDESFIPPALNASVHAIAVQPDGGILVGGAFTNVAQTARSGLIRLHANGALDLGFDAGVELAGQTNQFVSTVVLQPDGKVLFGGSFTNVQGFERRGLARLQADGRLDPEFKPEPDPLAYGYVKQLMVQEDGRILVGVAQTQVQFPEPKLVLRLTRTGALDSSFDLHATAPVYWHAWLNYMLGPGFLGMIFDSGGGLLVNGDFYHLPWQAIVRVKPDGSPDTNFLGRVEQLQAWTPPSGPTVLRQVRASVVDQEGKITIGGIFNRVGTLTNTPAELHPVGRLARFNADGTVDPKFASSRILETGSTVEQLRLDSEGAVLAAGNLTARGPMGTAHRNLVRLLAPYGTLDEEFTPEPNGPVLAMALETGGRLLIGGSFNTVQGTARGGVARLHRGNPVRHAPLILLQPQNMAASLGTNAHMTVVADGGGLTFQWFFNDAPIAGATNETLFLGNLTPAQAGPYSVSLSNSLGTLRSDSAKLAVLSLGEALNAPELDWQTGPSPWAVPAPWVVQGSVTHDGIAAARSTADAGALTSELLTQVEGPGWLSFWAKMSEIATLSFSVAPIATNPPTSWPAQSVTTILRGTGWTNFTSSLGPGKFNLIWSSSGPDHVLDEVQFVRPDPSAQITPSAQVVPLGQSARLEVTVPGEQDLKFQWQRNGEDIPGATNRTVLVPQISTNDVGSYAVLIQDRTGTHRLSTAGSLQVMFPPTLVWPHLLDFEWIRTIAEAAYGSPRPSLDVTGGRVTATDSFVLLQCNEAGSNLWRFSSTNRSFVDVAAGPDGSAYAAEPFSVAKFDAAGRELWRTEGSGFISRIAASLVDGSCYAVGVFNMTIQFGTQELQFLSTSSVDTFLVKFDAHGTALWAKRLGTDALSPNFHLEPAVAVDGVGNVSVTTAFRGVWCPERDVMDNSCLPGGPSFTSSNDTDAFVGKYDPEGNLVWARRFSGQYPLSDYLGSIAVNPWNEVLAAGGSWQNAFAKFGSDGTMLWTQSSTGHSFSDLPVAALDAEGFAYVAAFPESGTLSRLNAIGSPLWKGGWLTTNSSWSAVTDLAVTPAGDVFLTGSGNGILIAGDQQLGRREGGYSFLAKLRKTLPDAAPLLATQPEDQTIAVGAEARFTTTVTGTAPFRFQWLFNGAPLSGETNNMLVIAGAREEQSGHYEASISNDAGTVRTPTAQLTVVPPAGLPALKASRLRNSVLLHWSKVGAEPVLEAREAVRSDGVWAPVVVEPTQIASEQVVPISASQQRSFYRLRSR